MTAVVEVEFDEAEQVRVHLAPVPLYFYLAQVDLVADEVLVEPAVLGRQEEQFLEKDDGQEDEVDGQHILVDDEDSKLVNLGQPVYHVGHQIDKQYGEQWIDVDADDFIRLVEQVPVQNDEEQGQAIIIEHAFTDICKIRIAQGEDESWVSDVRKKIDHKEREHEDEARGIPYPRFLVCEQVLEYDVHDNKVKEKIWHNLIKGYNIITRIIIAE